MITMTEKTVQTLLLDYTMQSAAHRIALPNVTDNGQPRIADWEMDLLSVNRSGFSNEYEIKLSRSDYLKDRQKEAKHANLLSTYTMSRKEKGWKLHNNTPNYFWYVTYGFEIEPPDYAGWMAVNVCEDYRRNYLVLKMKKKAPRLHAGLVGDERMIMMGRLLAYRLSHAYRKLYKYSERKETPVMVLDAEKPA